MWQDGHERPATAGSKDFKTGVLQDSLVLDTPGFFQISSGRCSYLFSLTHPAAECIPPLEFPHPPAPTYLSGHRQISPVTRRDVMHAIEVRQPCFFQTDDLADEGHRFGVSASVEI